MDSFDKSVVVTGSSRGIGRGLAEEFLERGCRVTLSGRDEKRLGKTAAELGDRYGAGRVASFRCDVTDYEQVRQLWSHAAGAFGSVDIWINNAGLANPSRLFPFLEPEVIERVVATNITGTMFGCRVALGEMTVQGHGAIYNFEGFGSNGRVMKGLSIYGTTKRAIRYYSRSLARENRDGPVVIGTLNPGMVVTDLLTGDMDAMDEVERNRFVKIVNIIGERVETVAPYLVDRMLQNDRNGVRIEWLTGGKAMMKFLAAPFTKRNLFDPSGVEPI